MPCPFPLKLVTGDCNTKIASKKNRNGFVGSLSGRVDSSVKTWGGYTAAGTLSAATYCSLSGAATTSLSIKAQIPRTKRKFLAWDFVDAAEQVPSSMHQLMDPNLANLGLILNIHA